MAEQVNDVKLMQGRYNIVALRVLSDIKTKDASLLAYETENTDPKTRSFDTIVTKSGNVVNLGEVEYSPTTTSYVEVGSEQVKTFEEAFEKGSAIELWHIDRLEKASEDDKYEAKYKRGYIVNFEKTAGAEDLVELSMEFAIYGRERSGKATLTKEQVELLESQYEFTDTVAQKGEE